jgi:hypothetical protein
VTVFDSGTSSLSSIFDDNTGTSKANPFTADVNGFWFFYADDGRYDVRFSSGAPPISTPFSWGDVLLDERGTETCTETESQLAFAVVTCVDSTINANAGGDYSAASKVSYEPLRVDLNGRTKGQHILIGGAVNGYGIGDALFIGGDVFGYGGKFVTGTSQPTVEFAEINIRQGNKVFTAQVSGDPASGATTVNYTAEANEDVLGERLLINTSRTVSTGTVTGIANDVVSFSGAPDWTTFSPSPVGQYFKIDSEDVTLTGVLTGHWYRVTEVVSATQLRLETTYSGELASAGAYTLAEGAEIVGFDSAANTLTIESNSYDWTATDALASPPGHLVNFRGINLILSKEFKTGTARVLHASNTLGPFRWEKGILLEGNSNGAGGFTTGIDLLNINADVGLSLEKSTYTDAAIKLANSQPIRWGSDADFTFDGSQFEFNRSGRFVSANAGVAPLIIRHAASPTVDHFSIERSDGAQVFGVDKDGTVKLKPAFGTGLQLNPDTTTLSAIGGNTNIGLGLVTKGTGQVKVNGTSGDGTGGFSIWSGGSTPFQLAGFTTTTPLVLRHQSSPSDDHFRVERNDGAVIFEIDKDGVANMKPAFGTGLQFDPDSIPTLKPIGTNTNVGLRLDSKGNQPVAVNANTNAGTGGFEVYSGGASPALHVRLHADADKLSFGNTVSITTATGAPTGSCVTGSLYLRADGGAGTTLYVCEAGSWAAK